MPKKGGGQKGEDQGVSKGKVSIASKARWEPDSLREEYRVQDAIYVGIVMKKEFTGKDTGKRRTENRTREISSVLWKTASAKGGEDHHGK